MIMKKIIYFLLVSLWIISCDDDESYPVGRYFTLSETQVNFDNRSGEKSVEFTNPQDVTNATVVSDNSDWCTTSVSEHKITIKVAENVLFQSRTAKVLVTSGDSKIELLVRQGRKNFDRIAAVKNLEAIAKPGAVTLKWEEPTDDNFSFVIITYMKKDEWKKIVLENGVTEYTINELLNEDGMYTFYVQSYDKDQDPGEISEANAIPNKLVAFRFEKELDTQWVPYYLKTSDVQKVTWKVGSMEFNPGEQTSVVFEIDESLLDTYNKEHGTELQLIPSASYALPEQFLHTGTTAYQELSIDIHTATLKDRTTYALPIRIQSATPAVVSDIMSSMVVVFYVDDLQGWYTVDRLPNCGEGAGAYPSDAKDRRRYIKRTGDTTWETGYLFRCYVNNEEHTGSGTSVQYITIDPATKTIFMQQGSYAVSESHNAYDATTNELNIEYLYSEWAGWWTHERMYNRSLTK